jgi:hypothetical protein
LFCCRLLTRESIEVCFIPRRILQDHDSNCNGRLGDLLLYEAYYTFTVQYRSFEREYLIS